MREELIGIWREKSTEKLIEITDVTTDNSCKTAIHYKYSNADTGYKQYINYFCDRFSKVESKDTRDGEYVECIKVRIGEDPERYIIGKKYKVTNNGYPRIFDEHGWLTDLNCLIGETCFKPCLAPTENVTVYNPKIYEPDLIIPKDMEINSVTFKFNETPIKSNIKVNRGIKNVTFQDVNDNEVIIDVYEDSIGVDSSEIYYEDLDKWIEALTKIRDERKNL